MQPDKAIIVRLIEPPGDPTGLADVLVGSLGLTGAIALAALIAGLALGGLLFWFRSRDA